LFGDLFYWWLTGFHQNSSFSSLSPWHYLSGLPPSVLLLSFILAQVDHHSLAPRIFVDTGPSILWIQTKIIVKSSTIHLIWTTTWRPQFALYFQTRKHSNTAIWYSFQKLKSTCNLMNQLTCLSKTRLLGMP
jgi:hypothetical protein